MKLTKRERIMLIVLAAVAIVALSYYLLFRPQLAKIETLNAELAGYDQRIADVESELQTGGNLDAELEAARQRISERTKRFYPEDLQDQLILTLDDLLTRNGLVSNAYTFGRLTVKDVAQAAPAGDANSANASAFLAKDLTSQYNQLPSVAAQMEAQSPVDNNEVVTGAIVPTGTGSGQGGTVQSMNVSLQVSGTYDGLLQFMRDVEGQQKAIVVNSLQVNKDEAGQAMATMSLDFFAVPKLFGTDVAGN